MELKFSLAQIDARVGDFETNVTCISQAYLEACRAGSRFLLTPELSLCGYLPQDHLDRPEFFELQDQALQRLLALTQNQTCALVVGYVALSRPPNPLSHLPQNVVSVLEKGAITFTQAKNLLPRHDIFDESRYFKPAQSIQLWKCDGYSIALAICEDLWGHESTSAYESDPVKRYAELSPDLIVSLSASPYEWGKHERRLNVHRGVVATLQIPLVYVNRIGVLDSALFDGCSFILDAQQKVILQLPAWKAAQGEGCLHSTFLRCSSPSHNPPSDLSKPGKLAEGLIFGIRTYFQATGFKKAILGLSGGIDSAVVATLATQALGPRSILGVAMPSAYSSPHSLEDAQQLAQNLGIDFAIHSIETLFPTILQQLGKPLNGSEWSSLTQENLQSRLRGMILMTLSNQYSGLVLGTGNKSEFAMGYTTLYGDMIGALCPIGDLYKTRVYELARYLNEAFDKPVPQRSLDKAPSAELRPDQKDEEALPPYSILDLVLEAYLEKKTPLHKIRLQYGAALDQTRMNLDQLIRTLHLHEYKRKQAPLIFKTSPKAFGPGRRISMMSWS